MVYVKIWTSEQFGKLSDRAKLLFIGTITLADDDGKLRANPAYLRGQIFPYHEDLSVTDVLQLRNEIEKNGLIQVYSIDEFDYIKHPKWEEYQIIRKDLYKGSSLPSRNETVTSPLRKRTLSKVKLSKVKLSKVKQLSPDLKEENNSFEEFYTLYPKKLAKKEAEKAWDKLSEEKQLKALEDVKVRKVKHSQWIRDGGKYIPYPASYLNGERWEDEIITDKVNKQEVEPGKYDNIKQKTIKIWYLKDLKTLNGKMCLLLSESQ